MDIITTGAWQLTAFTEHTTTGDIDMYSSYDDCRKDDYLRFNKDGTGENNEGPSKCNGTDPQSRFMQWKFLDKTGNEIEIDGENYVIERLDDNNFRFYTLTTDIFTSTVSKSYSR